MKINLNESNLPEELNNFTGTLRIIVTTDVPYHGEVDYLLWERRDTNKWINEFEIVKGKVNSQRYAKYSENGKLTTSFSFN